MMPDCFKCKRRGTEWFDGPGAAEKRRAICRDCEYNDWRATVRSLNAPQG